MKRDELMRTRPVMPLDLGSFDLKRFGIVAIRIMRGTDVLRAWEVQ
jgi:hypothetical protein